ncbi:MAG: hypothetical protein U1F27_12550 [Turneriella sp.]
MKKRLFFTTVATIASLSAQSNPVLKLGGTLASDKGQSRAIIELGNGKTTEVCAAGRTCSQGKCDCEVAGYKVMRIEPRKVTLQRGGERFALTIDGLRSAGDQSGKYARVFAHDFARAKIQQTIDQRGAKARDILQSLFSAVDLKPTDTVVSVQGIPVPERVRWGTVYGGIASAEQIAIEIERDGKLMLLQLRVKN